MKLKPPKAMVDGVLGGLAFAVLSGMSYAPIGLWPAGLVALPVMMLLIFRASGDAPVRTAIGVGLGSLPVWAWTHGWVFGVAWSGGLLLTMQLGLYVGLFAWVVGVVRRRWGLGWAVVLWPFVWSGLEWFRSELFWGGYSWYVPAQGLIEMPAIAAAAGVIGFAGVGMLVALFGAGLVGLWMKEWRRLGAVWSVAVVVVWSGLSWWGWAPSAEGPVLRVAAVQTSMAQSVRGVWTTSDRLAEMESMIELTRQASLMSPPPDVIVWPETMFPGDTLAPVDVDVERAADLIWIESLERGDAHYTSLVWRGRDGLGEPAAVTRMADAGSQRYMPSLVCADTLVFWQETFGIPMLVGSDGYEGLAITTDEQGVPETQFEARYNSVHLLRDGRVTGERYDKHRLTPFGEVMPVIEYWKSAQDWLLNAGIGATGMRFDLARGVRSDRATRFEFATSTGERVRVATPVCFEGTSASVCRALVSVDGERRADVLVGLTNDGWFDRWPVGREAHLSLTRWRSVETWTPMVRSANTGVSASVDVHGRVVDRLEEWEVGVLMAEVRGIGGGEGGGALSPYSLGGHRAALAAPIGLVGLLVVRGGGWVRGWVKRFFQRREGDRTDGATRAE